MAPKWGRWGEPGFVESELHEHWTIDFRHAQDRQGFKQTCAFAESICESRFRIVLKSRASSATKDTC
jgi:hypothetical protein